MKEIPLTQGKIALVNDEDSTSTSRSSSGRERAIGGVDPMSDTTRIEDHIAARDALILDLVEQRNRLQQRVDRQSEGQRRNQFAIARRNTRITHLEVLVQQHEEQANATLRGYGIVVDQREAALAENKRLRAKLERRSRLAVRLLNQVMTAKGLPELDLS